MCGLTTLFFTVPLAGPPTLPLAVHDALPGGTATTADSDYNAAAGSLTFNPGQTTKTVTVLVNGDTKYETDETFSLNLSAATNTSVSRPRTSTVTIQMVDAQPVLSITRVTLNE